MTPDIDILEQAALAATKGDWSERFRVIADPQTVLWLVERVRELEERVAGHVIAAVKHADSRLNALDECRSALDAAEARIADALSERDSWRDDCFRAGERVEETDRTLSTLIHALRRKYEPNSLAAGEPPDMETVFGWLGVRQ